MIQLIQRPALIVIFIAAAFCISFVQFAAVSLASPAEGSTKVSDPIPELQAYLIIDREKRPLLSDQPFATANLELTQSIEAQRLLWADHAEMIQSTRKEEMEAREIKLGELSMPFAYERFGEKPATGRSLYISMHGGGNAPSRVNTQQWENQKRLYRPSEGIYLAPRAPTDTWDLWHQSHIDAFLDRLIENLIVFEDVDPNRVYLMGYSAGGDGVFQVAPRMADRFAAASMMAGHPNESVALGLRNLPFAIHMGEKDAAFRRNEVAKEWKQNLDQLHNEDPDGYVHFVKLHEGKGHWMDRQDAEAVTWMAQFNRSRAPTKIVWKQDDVFESRFYWLKVDPKDALERALVKAGIDGQIISIYTSDIDKITIRLNDEMFSLDKPIIVKVNEMEVVKWTPTRTIAVLDKTIRERGDPSCIYSFEGTVDVAKSIIR